MIDSFPNEEEVPVVPPVVGGIKDYGTAINENASVIADFRKGETPVFFLRLTVGLMEAVSTAGGIKKIPRSMAAFLI